VIAVFALNLLAITWPTVTLFRDPEPLILGLPMSMAWPIGWILIGWVTLLALDFSEKQGEGQ